MFERLKAELVEGFRWSWDGGGSCGDWNWWCRDDDDERYCPDPSIDAERMCMG